MQRIGTRRGWVVVMQLLVAAGLACAALAIPMASFLRWSLVALAATAISSATHDVAADGFYLIALSPHQQAWFVGIRSTAYRMATIAGQGLLVMLAGMLESSTGLPVIDVQVRAADVAPAASAFRSGRIRSFADGGVAANRCTSERLSNKLSRSQCGRGERAAELPCTSGTFRTDFMRIRRNRKKDDTKPARSLGGVFR